MTLRSLVAPVALLAAVACGSSEGDDSTTGAGGAGGGAVNTKNLVSVPGVRIDGIAAYQGPKRTLMIGGEPQQSNIPLVAGRDIVFRVFYTTNADYTGQEVIARLEIDGGDPLLLPTVLQPYSVEEDMATTVNFGVSGDRIGDTINYSVNIMQELPKELDNPLARYPQQGLASVPVEGRRNRLRIVLLPLQYDADGSHRIPDVSEDHVAEIRDRFKAMYPVSEVEMTVHDPVPFNSPIGATGGAGWQQVGFLLAQTRFSEGAPDDVYYYAMFDPADSIAQYCGLGGCVLGLTLLNNNPPSTGSAMLRGGMGVGFRGFAANTAAHEIGHSHGRRHSPCGPGVQDVDPAYPHPGGVIGEWAYDLTQSRLVEPTATDIMGYCMNQFISDFNYISLHKRGQNVNLEAFEPGPPVTYDLVAVDGSGRTTWGPAIDRTRPYDGRRVRVRASRAGVATSVEARFLEWDHLPGGMLFVPRAGNGANRLEFVIDGVKSVARR